MGRGILGDDDMQKQDNNLTQEGHPATSTGQVTAMSESRRGDSSGLGRRVGLVLIMLAVVWVVFGQIRSHGFVNWDDDDHILGNPHFKPVTLQKVIRHTWVDPYNKDRYMPVTYSFWALEAYIDQQISGQPTRHSPPIFHLGSLLLHSLCTFLMFIILNRFVPSVAACLGALLFALHPLQVESVALISGTDVLLSGLFSLVAIWQYMCFVTRTGSAPSSAGFSSVWLPRHWFHYALATTCLALALLSKPTAASVPLIVLVIDRWLFNRPLRQSLVSVSPWLLIVAVFAVTMALRENDSVLGHYPMWVRPLVAVDAIAFYLYKLVLPLQLCLDHGRSPAVILEQGWAYVTWVVPCAIVTGFYWITRLRPALFSSGLTTGSLFLAGVLPTLGLVPHYFQATSTVVDRYVYLAMLGPALGLALIAGRWRQPAIVACSVAVCLLGLLGYQQVRIWRDSESLFEHTLRVNPRSFTARINLGSTLLHRNNLEGAVEQFQHAIELQPESAEAHNNLAVALGIDNRLDEAIYHYEKALQINPDFTGAKENLMGARQMLRNR